jgi:hypothetical protein
VKPAPLQIIEASLPCRIGSYSMPVPWIRRIGWLPNIETGYEFNDDPDDSKWLLHTGIALLLAA